jgi:hypothetical protein
MWRGVDGAKADYCQCRLCLAAVRGVIGGIRWRRIEYYWRECAHNAHFSVMFFAVSFTEYLCTQPHLSAMFCAVFCVVGFAVSFAVARVEYACPKLAPRESRGKHVLFEGLCFVGHCISRKNAPK